MKNEALANEIRAIRTEINQKIHAGLDGEQFAGIKSCLVSIEVALRANAAPQGGRDHDFAHILQLCSDTDEADPKKLLQEIAAIANKHPWPIPASSPAAGHAEGGAGHTLLIAALKGTAAHLRAAYNDQLGGDADIIDKAIAVLVAPPDSVVVPREPAAWKFRMDGIDQVILDEDADIHIRRHGVPLYLTAAPKGDKHG